MVGWRVLVVSFFVHCYHCFIDCYLYFVHCFHYLNYHYYCRCHCHCRCYFPNFHLMVAGFSYFVCSLLFLISLFIAWVCSLMSRQWLLLVIVLIWTDNLGSILFYLYNFWLLSLPWFNLLLRSLLVFFRILMSIGRFVLMSIQLWFLETFLIVELCCLVFVSLIRILNIPLRCAVWFPESRTYGS